MALPTLNAAQVYALLVRNGASQQEAIDLTSMAKLESGYDPNQLNPNVSGTGDYSVGLFQFNFAPGAGNFNASNPDASTRGNWSAGQLKASLDAQAQSALWLYRSVASKGSDPTCATAAWFHCGASKSPGIAAAQAVGDKVDQILADIGVSGTPDTSGSSPTSAASGSGPSGINLGSVAGQPINIPTGLVLGLVGALLLVLGAILFASNAQNTVKSKVVGAVTERL